MQQYGGGAPQPPIVWQIERDVEQIRRERSQGAMNYLSVKDLLDAICLRMNVMSFVELNVGAPYAIPAIRQVVDIENSLWDFVGAYVMSRSMSTVYEAEMAFLQQQRVNSFDALGVGTSFAMSPPVVYHFNLSLPMSAPVARLSMKNVLEHLRDFRFVMNRQTQDSSIFLAYLAEKLSVPVGSLGVTVLNMSRSIELLRRIFNEERKELRKFSAENREKAIDEALQQQDFALPEGNQKANKVTRLDSELDQQIRKYQDRLPKNIAATISAQDIKLRGKVVNKKHQKSRSTVVTWVLCSIIAKSRVLLDAENLEPLNNARRHHTLPEAKEEDDDECKCCCVGKDSCTCSCTCSCHVMDEDEDSDDDDDEDEPNVKLIEKQSSQPQISESTLQIVQESLNKLFSDEIHQDNLLKAIFKKLRELEVEIKVPSLLSVLEKENIELPNLPRPSRNNEMIEALIYQCRVAKEDFSVPPSEELASFMDNALTSELDVNIAELPASIVNCIQPPKTPVAFLYPLLTPMSSALNMTLSSVLSALRSLPCLMDIEMALGWSVHYEVEFGAFIPFFQHHFPHIPLLRLPGPSYCKLLPTLNPSSIQLTTAIGDDIALHVVSILVKSREKCPWDLLEAAIVSVLKQVPSPCLVILDALRRIPHTSLLPIVAPTILKSLGAIVHNVPEKLWQACLTSDDYLRLGIIGTLTSVPLWKDYYESFLTKGNFPTGSATLPPAIASLTTKFQTSTTSQPPIQKIISHKNVVQSTPVIDSSECQALVNTIRKENFGIGLAVTPETQTFLQLQHQRLERALKRLSEELYATSTHFVLELIQNADDNTYNDTPEAKFHVSSDNITFYCNELGFQPKHIRALCDVGASTKSQGSSGYIGQKGIGFKSVFSVTHCPEIHSNGYHVRFNADPNHTLGPDHVNYILPYWIDTPSFKDQRGTYFHFPLHRQAQEQLQTTCALLSQIQPSILLFLNQLQSLEIKNDVLETTVHFQKRWISSDTVELQTETSSQQWFVSNRTLLAPKSNLRENVQEGAETKIQVAFPIYSADTITFPLQSVFAYLPLQSYGFRCILQADFEVPSSREAVLDSPWNQWLLLEFPALFVDAFVSLVQLHPHLIRLLPLVHDIQPPFQLMAQEIGIRLQQAACVQTTNGVWVAPISVIDPWDTISIDGDGAKLTPNEDQMWEFCQKHYLNHQFSSFLSPEMKRVLGIQPLCSTHLLQVASGLGAQKKKQSLEWYSSLILQLAHIAHRERALQSVTSLLKDIALFPIQASEGSWTLTTCKSTIFLPQDVLPTIPFASAIQLLVPDIVAVISKDPIALQFVLAVGVMPLQAKDVISHHLLPYLKTHNSKSDHAAVMGFILEYYSSRGDFNESLTMTIREGVKVITSRGHLVPLSQSQLYLPNPDTPTKPFDMMSIIDVNHYGAKSFAFFDTILNIPMFLSLKNGPNIPGLQVILAYISEAENAAIAKALLKYLDATWRVDHTLKLSDAVKILTKYAWIPAQLRSIAKLELPELTYLPLRHSTAVLQKFASIVTMDISNQALIDMLHIRRRLGCKDIINLLNQDAVLEEKEIIACYTELHSLDLTTSEKQELQNDFEMLPLIINDGKRYKSGQCVWKMQKDEKSFHGIIVLYDSFPKELKPFFLSIGIPQHPTMSNVLAAMELCPQGEIRRPLLDFIASHWQEALPFKALLDNMPLLTSIDGTLVSFSGSDLRWAKGIPTWFDAIDLKNPLVDISSPENESFESLVQAWPSHNLEAVIASEAEVWCRIVTEVCSNSEVQHEIKQSLVQDVLEIWMNSDIEVIPGLDNSAIFPNQARLFGNISDVRVLVEASNGSHVIPQLRHHSLLDLRYDAKLQKYLIELGMPTMEYTIAISNNSSTESTSLLDRIRSQFYQSRDQLPQPSTTVTIDNMLTALSCQIATDLHIEYKLEDKLALQQKVPIAYYNNQLYIEEPLNDYMLFLTLAKQLWESPELAASIANALFITSLQTHTQLSTAERLWSQIAIPDSRAKRKLEWATEQKGKRQRSSQSNVFQMEIPYDQGKLSTPRTLQLTDEMRLEIGRAGESYVANVLRESLGDKVEWVNEIKETGLPYDICIEHSSGGREYIEVKSTSTFDKMMFEMSVQELDFAGQQGSQYSIYRVFQVKPYAGPVVNCPIVKLRNPMTLLRQKKLKLSIAIEDSVMKVQ
ncbi:phosphoserine aminotransferase [Thraustotheca clavata]|uniref:Phosphoserine aminotransferase n=1 Tax=Thraustotheca clavata TaxID=74557 RepID=A0A1V9ZQG2_9STRA|nr:phosphoserine aminotransferase [Thraustotheca clavata]